MNTVFNFTYFKKRKNSNSDFFFGKSKKEIFHRTELLHNLKKTKKENPQFIEKNSVFCRFFCCWNFVCKRKYSHAFSYFHDHEENWECFIVAFVVKVVRSTFFR